MTGPERAAAGGPSATRSRWPLRVLQFAVAIGLLVVVWRAANGGQALELLREAELSWLLLAALLLTGQIMLSARRWRLTGERLGMTISWPQAWQEYYLSQVVNQTIPGGVVGDAARAIRSKDTAGLVPAAHSVILERLAGQIALLAVCGGGLVASAVSSRGPDWPVWLVTFLLTAGALVLLLLVSGVLLGRTGDTRAGRVVRDFSDSAARSLFSAQVRWRQLALSLGTALANISGFWACAMAIGVAIPIGHALALIPLILIMMLIPVSVSGWGLREGASALLFPVIGFSAAEGFAASVAFGLVLIVIALPGLFFLRARRDRQSR